MKLTITEIKNYLYTYLYLINNLKKSIERGLYITLNTIIIYKQYKLVFIL